MRSAQAGSKERPFALIDMKKQNRQSGYIDGDDIGLALIIFTAAVVSIGLLLFGIAWGDGHAKSAYIKQTQGIDIPWYQATWLEVHVNDVNLKTRQ